MWGIQANPNCRNFAMEQEEVNDIVVILLLLLLLLFVLIEVFTNDVL